MVCMLLTLEVFQPERLSDVSPLMRSNVDVMSVTLEVFHADRSSDVRAWQA